MKIIIAQSTVASFTNHVVDIVETCAGKPLSESERQACNVSELAEFRMKNQSLTRVGQDIHFEVNDAVLLRFASLYVKVARFLAPIVRGVIEFMKSLDSEMQQIAEMVNEPCDDITEEQMLAQELGDEQAAE